MEWIPDPADVKAVGNVREVTVIGFQHQNQRGPARRGGELGASLVEYALLLALIAAVCIGAVSYFGQSNDTGLNRSKDCISAAYDDTAMPANCSH